MTSQRLRDLGQLGTGLPDQFRCRLPLTSMQGPDPIGGGTDHPPRTGDRLLPGREACIEHGTGVVGEMRAHRLVGDDLDLGLFPLRGTFRNVADLEPPLPLLLHLGQGHEVEGDERVDEQMQQEQRE